MLSSACLLLSAPCAFAQAFVPVTQSILANPDPADWLMINRTFDEQRFSPLDQINKTNVGQLRMAWSRGLPNGTQESTPIVYRGVMYLYAPGASIQAVDATNGDLIWEYTRNYPRDLSATAARNKSLGIFEDMIYFAAPDGFLVALDARTGKIRWETKVDNGGQTAGGLLVADGKVISNRCRAASAAYRGLGWRCPSTAPCDWDRRSPAGPMGRPRAAPPACRPRCRRPARPVRR